MAVTSVNGQTGVVVLDAADVGVRPPDFISAFGGVGDGVTSNNSAFTAAEASAFDVIWLPEGRFYTTLSSATLTKTYVGPGRIYYGANATSLQNTRFLRADVPVVPADDDVQYGVNQTTRFTDYEYIRDTSKRRNFETYLHSPGRPQGFNTYFWAPAHPHFVDMSCDSGWSGRSSQVAGPLTVGQTVITIPGGVMKIDGTQGWNVGDVVGFFQPSGNPDADMPKETRTITAVNTGAGTITLNAGLSFAYLADAYISHGFATNQSYLFTVQDYKGGGHNFFTMTRLTNSYVPLSSQPNWSYTGTIGAYGAELVCTQHGQYMTGAEWLHHDSGKDVSAVGLVLNFYRSNTVDTGKGCVWTGTLIKNEGATPMNQGLAVVGKHNVGISLGLYTDFGAKKAAIGMKKGDRIHFDMQLRTNPYAIVSADIFPTYDIYLGSGEDGQGRYIEMKNASASGTGYLLVRPTTVEVNQLYAANTISVGTHLSANGNVNAGGLNITGLANVGGNLAVTGNMKSQNGNVGTNKSFGELFVNTNGAVKLGGEGSNTYLQYNGNFIFLVKNGTVVATW